MEKQTQKENKSLPIDAIKKYTPHSYTSEGVPLFEFEDVISAMNTYANQYRNLPNNEPEWKTEIKRRLQMICYEPNGIVRETMINNLLIDL